MSGTECMEYGVNTKCLDLGNNDVSSLWYGLKGTKRCLKQKREKLLQGIQDNLCFKGKENVKPNDIIPCHAKKTHTNKPRPRGTFSLGSYVSRKRRNDYLSRKSTPNKKVKLELPKKTTADKGTQSDTLSVNLSQLGQQCLQLLQDYSVILPLINKLEHGDCLEDFMKLIKNLSSGLLPVDNMAWLLLLDRSTVLDCKSTTNMRYKDKVKKFWACVYSVCRGAGLRLFGGMKNAGNIVTGLARRGKLDPKDAIMNFCVPDERVLRDSIEGLPRSIQPGIISPAINCLKMDKEYILTFDGKKIAPGLLGSSLGDINLWGKEKGSTVNEQILRLEREIRNIKFLHSELPVQETIDTLQYILKINTGRIRDVRVKLARQRFLRDKLVTLSERNPDNPNKYKYAISGIDAHEYTSKKWINSTLKKNCEICELLAELRGTGAYFRSEDANWYNLKNVNILDSPQVASHYFDTSEHTNLVKQRTPEWFKIREEFKVTGSTIYNALGLRTLKEQRRHYNRVVLSDETDYFTDAQKKYMAHGQENEINALTTVMSLVVPALQPNCVRFIEQGAFVIDGQAQKKLIAVSPDGLLCCSRPVQSCTECTNPDADKIVIEVKCPFPKDGDQVQHHYTLPVYYTVQILAELHATKSSKAWLVSYGPTSTVVLEVYYNAVMWTDIWNQICTLYDVDNIRRPIKLEPNVRELKQKLTEYAAQNTCLLVEIPSIHHIDGAIGKRIQNGPYLQHEDIFGMPMKDTTDLCKKLSQLADEVEELILESHDLTRNKATELLAFVISDTDRFSSSETPHHLPIAYALKGNSLPTDTLRLLIDDVRNILLDMKINVLCECMDGQWINLATRDCNGKPLTKLQLQKSVWQKVLKMRKAMVIEELCQISEVSLTDQEALSNFPKNSIGIYTFGNIVLSHHSQVPWKIYSNRGGLYDAGMIGLIKTTSNPGVWKSGRNVSRKTMSLTGEDSDRKLTRADIADLVYEELNNIIVHPDDTELGSTDQYSSDQCMNDMVQCILDINAEEEIETEEPHYDNENVVELDQEKNGEDTSLLMGIIQALKDTRRKDTWENVTPHQLYTNYLASAESIDSNFFSKELDAIAQAIYEKTEIRPFKVNEKKHIKTNILSSLFGDNSIKACRTVRRNVTSLKSICKNFISKPAYPKQVLCVALATCRMKNAIKEWENNATVPMTMWVPGNRQHNCYSYPEFSLSRKQIEPRTIDPTHVLTNLRTHATQKGFKDVNKHAFVRATETDDSVVSKIILERNLDQQNASIAKSIFSPKFAAILERNGDTKEAQFVMLISNWYAACDERGIPAATRIHYMLDLYDYLIADVNFERFPPYTQYINGYPVVTFESLLQGITTRLQLFTLSLFGALCLRAITTLDVENLFSEVSKLAISLTGCPKAVNIPVLMARLIRLNIIRQDVDRGFAADLCHKSCYPNVALQKKKLAEEDSTSGSEFEIINGSSTVTVKDHLFDSELQPHKKKRTSNDSHLPDNCRTQKREKGVRDNYKIFPTMVSPMSKCKK